MGASGGNSANLFMAGASLTQASSSFATGIAQSAALTAQGNFQKQQFDFNSQLAELQAGDAIKRGYTTASQYKKSVKKVVGAQRTSLAAQGVDIGTGSAMEIQQDTKNLSEIDAMTIKNNAWQEAWGFKMQALDLSSKGQYAQMSTSFEAKNSILAGGIAATRYGFESGYYGYKYLKGGSKT